MSLQNYEQYVLDAEKAFEQGLYHEGKAYLDNAIAEEPTYGKAHSHKVGLISYRGNEVGRHKEVTGNFFAAIKFYRMAIRWSMDREEIELIRDNIKRAKSKRWLFLNI